MYAGKFYQHLSKPPFAFRGFLFVLFKYTVLFYRQDQETVFYQYEMQKILNKETYASFIILSIMYVNYSCRL